MAASRMSLVWLFDFQNVDNNEFLAVNQFTIIEERNNRRPDIILFVNGLPLVLIEFKNPADENATVWSAFNQFETYGKQIPSVFPLQRNPSHQRRNSCKSRNPKPKQKNVSPLGKP